MNDAVRIFSAAFFALIACADARAAEREAPTLAYRVVARHPHDTADFTQGLVLRGGRLLESTGQHGASALIEKDLASGRVLMRRALPREVFGEGLALTRDRVVQLTWRSQRAFVYDRALRPLGVLRYVGEGWGLTFDGAQLIRSDGSDRLRFHDAHSLVELRSVAVRDGARRVRLLNELEFARGLVWANLWQSDRVAAIDPDTGRVRAWLDLSALKASFDKPARWDAVEHVLNGIAWDARSGHFLVTGKCWPVLFELEVAALLATAPAPPRPSS